MTDTQLALWLEAFKIYMSFDRTDQDKDSIMEMLLLGVIPDLEAYGVLIGQRVVDEEVVEASNGVAFLPHYPVIVINSATVLGNSIDPADIKIKKNILEADTLTSEVTLDLTLGWDFDVAPMDIKIAIFKFTEKLYNDAVMEREGLSLVSNDIKQRASYRSEIPEFSMSVFKRYSVLVL